MKSRVLKYRYIVLFVSLLFCRFFYLEAESKQEKQGGILEMQKMQVIGRKTLKYKEHVFSILQTDCEIIKTKRVHLLGSMNVLCKQPSDSVRSRCFSVSAVKVNSLSSGDRW